MANCGLCRDCKHWENVSEFPEDMWGFCDMTHTKGQVEDAGHVPWHPGTKAKAVEEYYSGCLQTQSDFGCVQFERKRVAQISGIEDPGSSRPEPPKSVAR